MGGNAVFTGVVLTRVDDKGRLALPASLRNSIPAEAGGRIYIAFHETMPCLIGSGADFPTRLEAYLDAREEVAIRRNQDFDRNAASLRLYGGESVPIDGSGRFTMPELPAAIQGLGQELLMMGRGPYFEIWDLEALRSSDDPALADARRVAEGAVQLRDKSPPRRGRGA